jgi:hypothetical protein
MFWLGFGIGAVSAFVGCFIAFILESRADGKNLKRKWEQYSWIINCPECDEAFKFGINIMCVGDKPDRVAVADTSLVEWRK